MSFPAPYFTYIAGSRCGGSLGFSVSDLGSCIMKVRVLYLVVVFIFALSMVGKAQDMSYDYLIEMGMEAMKGADYAQAIQYFQMAEAVDPDAKEPQFYINLCKRASEGRVVSEAQPQPAPEAAVVPPVVPAASGADDYDRQLDDALTKLNQYKQELAKELPAAPGAQPEKPAVRIRRRQDNIQAALNTVEKKQVKAVKPASTAKPAAKPEPLPKAAKARRQALKLDPAIRDKFPLSLTLPVKQTLKIDSAAGVTRFLIIDPKKISAEKTADGGLVVSALDYGSTFLHVWDSSGRWTFAIDVQPAGAGAKEANKLWQDTEGFKIAYSSGYNTFFRGPSFSDMKRAGYALSQTLQVNGPCPYGKLDSTLHWAGNGTDSAFTDFTLGLKDGHWRNFDGFSARFFDLAQTPGFSALSLPGMALYGATFSSPAFNKKMDYTLVYGKEKSYSFGYLSAGLLDTFDSFIEGGRIGLHLAQGHDEFLNFAHGHGQERQAGLSDNVFSFQSRDRLGKIDLNSELGYDGDHFGEVASGRRNWANSSLALSLRNVDKDYQTITGRAAYAGEPGAGLNWSWRPWPALSLGSGLDVYRNRLDPNPNKPNALNYGAQGSANLQLSPTSRLNSDLYYNDTPGLSYPQKYWNFNTGYSKSLEFDFFGRRNAGYYAGYGFNRTLYEYSAGANYKRHSVYGGLNFLLLPNIQPYLNYQHYWLNSLSSGVEQSYSGTAGIGYGLRLTQRLSSSISVSYTKEGGQNSTGSALSGSDSADVSLGLSFTPFTDVELFCDSHARKVMPNDPATQKYVELQLTAGARVIWDSPIRWPANTSVEGYLFKDLNGNGKKDMGEEGLADVKVIIGPREVTTDKNGYYRASVRYKKVVVSVDMNTVPGAYICTTPATIEADVSRGGIKRVDFGMSNRSGIYGMVFVDANGNLTLDKGEKHLAGIRFILDGKRNIVSNSEGIYFFGDLMPGTHELKIDVDKLPMNYLPLVPVKKTIELLEGSTYAYHIPLQETQPSQGKLSADKTIAVPQVVADQGDQTASASGTSASLSFNVSVE